MMIFRPDTPKFYRVNTHWEDGGHMPPAIFWLPATPVLLGVVYLLIWQAVDWLFLGDWFDSGNVWGWPSCLLFPFVGWLLLGMWLARRRKYVERKTDDYDLKRMEQEFLALPLALRAELAEVRNVGFRYWDRWRAGDEGDTGYAGFHRCWRAIKKAGEVVDSREAEVLTHDAQPAMFDAMHYIKQFEKETAAMFHNELSAGPSDSEAEAR